MAPAPPGAPVNGAPGALNLSATRSGTNGARLSWPAVPRAASYAIYQAQGSTPLAFAFAAANPGTTLVGLASGVTYNFQVRARTVADEEFATSNTVTLTIDR
jgi:hypothetical protein